MCAVIAARHDGTPNPQGRRRPCSALLRFFFAMFCAVPCTVAARRRERRIAFAPRVFAFQELL